MAAPAQVLLRFVLTVSRLSRECFRRDNGDGTAFVVGASEIAETKRVSLAAAAFTAIAVPDGARLVYVDLKGATELVLKGVTGDAGDLKLTGAHCSHLLLPVDAAFAFGFLNNGEDDQAIEVTFL